MLSFQPIRELKFLYTRFNDLSLSSKAARGHPHMTFDFFKGFLTYLPVPTHVRFCPIVLVLFYLIVSDCKLTYLPQNRSSNVDDPISHYLSYLSESSKYFIPFQSRDIIPTLEQLDEENKSIPPSTK